MLELRPSCECCDCDLPPDSPDARICTYECTFCAECVEGRLGGVCPSCAGNFVPRPIRPPAALLNDPASTVRVYAPTLRSSPDVEPPPVSMKANGNRDLAALPKGHLHLHLEAAMRPETLAELCAERGMKVPEIGAFGDFSAFEATYGAASDVLEREEDFERLVREMLEDARADGAWYVEPALYAPAHRARFGSDERVVELVLDALQRFGGELGVGVGLMIAGDRMVDPRECEEQARLAARYADRGVVSFGLASDERGHPPEPFAPAFDIARAAGLISAPHAGELAGPASVASALEALGADRLQHGVRAIESPGLVAELADRGTCLDVCPTSNAALGVYPRYAEHPLPMLLAAGVRCSLNADDPLLFGCGLLDEYELCRNEMGLGDDDLAAVALASLEASGASPDLVERGSAGIRSWLGTGAGSGGTG